MIRVKDLEEFLASPATQELLELIQEHRQASYELITETMVNSDSVKDVDMFKIAQYRGQVYALDALLDIKEFLKERVEVKTNEKETRDVWK